jgi:hypothetical protein
MINKVGTTLTPMLYRETAISHHNAAVRMSAASGSKVSKQSGIGILPVVLALGLGFLVTDELAKHNFFRWLLDMPAKTTQSIDTKAAPPKN